MTPARAAPAALALAALALAAGLALGACATAPGTGRTIFTGGMSAEQEAALGAQEHDKLLPEFGGAYADPALGAYVSSIGNLLVQTTETPADRFTFTVLDTPVVNAFALPGGYVYVTRGLVALAGSEAELAGVLAHEIGHVTARHSAERYGQQVAASIANLGLGLVLRNGALSEAFGSASAMALQSFSREQEYEADLLGVRYMARAGYDPGAMAGFLSKLLGHSRLEAELRGQPGQADAFDIMQTHPRTADRIERAIREGGAAPVARPMQAREVYLGKIDGLLYGDAPEQGFVRGRRFLHPVLRIGFEVPAGFHLFNAPGRVVARGPDGAAILFDRAKAPGPGPMTAYLTQGWARGAPLEGVEAIAVNGMAGATGWLRLETRRGARDVRLVAIRAEPGAVYRMVFVTAPEQTAALAPALRATTYSLRRLSPEEAAALKPLRLRIHTVAPGESAAGLAERLPFEDFRLDRFLALNGLSAAGALRAGDRVKLVAP